MHTTTLIFSVVSYIINNIIFFLQNSSSFEWALNSALKIEVDVRKKVANQISFNVKLRYFLIINEIVTGVEVTNLINYCTRKLNSFYIQLYYHLFTISTGESKQTIIRYQRPNRLSDIRNTAIDYQI